ncbi:hypothetical protein GH714_013037 [Hevea brasiliensis]|uniref:RRM domain-containing protein n=1 Tax=Hevea brasiliensis TaxID=3981 RepID=A0A6A6MEU0_HEVBR|nr:hypothetical protein GH714_013037 [Hevea brasiliensis]
MAKVIKDRVTGVSKGYGFVKYQDVQMANNAIASPPASNMPSYPVSSQPVGAYPSQQFTPGGPLPNAPPAGYAATPTSYTGAPVPWAPPVPLLMLLMLLPSWVHDVSSCPGQPMPPYGVQYPPPVQPIPSGAPTQTVASSEAQQIYPPGVQSEKSASAPPPSSNIYGNSGLAMPSGAQPAYATASLGYSSYYNAVPPPPSAPVPIVDHAQGISNGPWAPNPPAPLPVPSASEKATYGTDPEYEKFMAEMK